jgi:uncharacterized membrane protein YcaP (DUF421 family)
VSFLEITSFICAGLTGKVAGIAIFLDKIPIVPSTIPLIMLSIIEY